MSDSLWNTNSKLAHKFDILCEPNNLRQNLLDKNQYWSSKDNCTKSDKTK